MVRTALYLVFVGGVGVVGILAFGLATLFDVKKCKDDDRR